MQQMEESGIKALMRFHAYANEGVEKTSAVDFSHGGEYGPRVFGCDKVCARGFLIYVFQGVFCSSRYWTGIAATWGCGANKCSDPP
ncbi:hypothetical protein [Malonomonas rubra]|uniref:hypothetical protein n=1 Tax=Malonomonas rubra TaxID=57040 RepID=UPI0026F023BA|nr:hypothetical protein [Malonomonas rubra]